MSRAASPARAIAAMTSMELRLVLRRGENLFATIVIPTLVDPDGRFLWASNRYDATVVVVSTRTGRVLHTIPVGAGPHGLTLFPQPGAFSLGHNGVYR